MTPEEQRDRWQRQEDARLARKLANEALAQEPDKFMRKVEVAGPVLMALGAVLGAAFLVYWVTR